MEEQLERDRIKESEEIDKAIDDEKARKLKELEESDLIMSEFKDKCNELDHSLEQERNRQKQQMDDRLAARRKKNEEELEKQRQQDLEKINKENEEKRKLQL